MTNQYNKKNKRIQNLFRNLQKDSKRVFYSILNSSRALWNKAEKSSYGKDYNMAKNSFLEEAIFNSNIKLPYVISLHQNKWNLLKIKLV